MAKTDPKRMTPQEQVLFLKKKLGYQVYEPPAKLWLDTGSKRLNSVFGSPELGIAYGKTITLAGKRSAGKTLLAILLAGMAQQDGATVGWVDVENSFDGDWAKIHNLDPGELQDDGSWSNIALLTSELGKFSKAKNAEVRMQAAEELFDLGERWMIMQREINPKNCKLCMVVDSTTAVEPLEELEAGLAGQNMRTKMLAPFLNRMTKRWNKVAYNTNAIIIYIAQLRTNPMAMFGSPDYITGGSGVLFYPSAICTVKRARKGGLLHGEDEESGATGVASIIQNIKNKVGGGGVEGASCGFTAKFSEFDWRFLAAKKLQNQMKGGGDE